MADDINNRENRAGSPPSAPANAPLTADELRAVAQEVSANYPPPRLGTELVLLEINPHRAHAYWNIDVEDYQTAAAVCGDPSPPILLRLHDITGIEFDGTNAHSFFDMQVQGLQGHWYVDLWKDGRTHIAEIGMRRADGRLEILARSNPVSTPPASESPNYHTEAVDTAQTEPELRLTDLSADPNLTPENTDVETGAAVDLNPPPLHVVPAPDPAAYRAPDAPADPSEPSTVAFLPSSEPPTETPNRNERHSFPLHLGVETRPTTYPPVGPSIRELDYPIEPVKSELPSEPLKSDAGETSTLVEDVGIPGAAPTDDEERPDWPIADELARFIPDSPSATEPIFESKPESASHPDSTPTESAPNPTAPQPAEASPVGNEPQHHEAPKQNERSFPPGPPASLPLENYVTLFSADHGHPQVALEVNVELHIFGRAKPGTQVTLYGQPVQLRPDGSFSLRKPLPYGAVVLPLIAIDPPKT